MMKMKKTPLNYIGMYGRNKCFVISTPKGIYLQSYNTIVIGITSGELHRYWNGYSKITMAHISAFITDYNVNNIKNNIPHKIEWNGVKDWDKMKVENCPITID